MDFLKIRLHLKRIRVQKWIPILLITLFTTLIFWQFSLHRPVHAQLDSASSFRLSRIETELRTLQSDIRQLESALGRVERQSGETVILQDFESPASPPSVPTNTPDTVQADLMFDQLATLVIETRQDMFALQEKVEAIEQTIEKESRP